MTTPDLAGQRGGGRGPAGWIALALHVLVGLFPYGASGLLAPPWGLGLLFVVWFALLVAVVRWKPVPGWWLLAVPAAAVALWFAIVTAGDLWFGWGA